MAPRYSDHNSDVFQPGAVFKADNLNHSADAMRYDMIARQAGKTHRMGYGPPRPWDHPHDRDRHRGRGPMLMARGAPIEVEFLGWRSDTYMLQQHGWQIAESRSPAPERYGEDWHIAIRHPDYGMSGMSNMIQQGREWVNHHGERIHLHMDIGLPMRIQHMPEHSYYPVDATPYHEEVRSPYDLYNQPYFKPIHDTKKIFLEKASMAEIMDIALSKQAPEQERIRKEMINREELKQYERASNVKAELRLVS